MDIIFKPGDKIYIREDLKIGERYGAMMFLESMQSGMVMTIGQIETMLGAFQVLEDNFYYTRDMIDTEKTLYIHIREKPGNVLTTLHNYITRLEKENIELKDEVKFLNAELEELTEMPY